MAIRRLDYNRYNHHHRRSYCYSSNGGFWAFYRSKRARQSATIPMDTTLSAPNGRNTSAVMSTSQDIWRSEEETYDEFQARTRVFPQLTPWDSQHRQNWPWISDPCLDPELLPFEFPTSVSPIPSEILLMIFENFRGQPAILARLRLVSQLFNDLVTPIRYCRITLTDRITCCFTKEPYTLSAYQLQVGRDIHRFSRDIVVKRPIGHHAAICCLFSLAGLSSIT